MAASNSSAVMGIRNETNRLSNNGLNYGLYSSASNGTEVYGVYALGSGGTGNNIGVYGKGDTWGGKFENNGSGKYVELGGNTYPVKIVDGTQGAGKVLTSDASGNAWWQNVPNNNLFTDYGNYLCPNGITSDEVQIADATSHHFGVYASTNTGNSLGTGGHFNHTNSYGSSTGLYASATSTSYANPSYTQGASIYCTSTSQDQRGIYNLTINHGQGARTYGLYNYVYSTADNTSDLTGMYCYSSKAYDLSSNVGIDVEATNGFNVFGIIAEASGGSNADMAGYFDGDVTITGYLTNPSDRKLKENISAMDNVMGKINQLNAVQYKYKNSGDAAKLNLPEGEQYGFVAQELEQIFPEFVKDQVHLEKVWSEQDGQKTYDYEESQYKAINYMALIPILTKAIQEQQEKMEQMQAEIDQLKNR